MTLPGNEDSEFLCAACAESVPVTCEKHGKLELSCFGGIISSSRCAKCYEEKEEEHQARIEAILATSEACPTGYVVLETLGMIHITAEDEDSTFWEFTSMPKIDDVKSQAVRRAKQKALVLGADCIVRLKISTDTKDWEEKKPRPEFGTTDYVPHKRISVEIEGEAVKLRKTEGNSVS